MGRHLFAMIIMVIGVAVGIIIAVLGNIKAGIIIAVLAVVIGFVIAAMNIWRLWKNPSKAIPKSW